MHLFDTSEFEATIEPLQRPELITRSEARDRVGAVLKVIGEFLDNIEADFADLAAMTDEQAIALRSCMNKVRAKVVEEFRSRFCKVIGEADRIGK